MPKHVKSLRKGVPVIGFLDYLLLARTSNQMTLTGFKSYSKRVGTRLVSLETNVKCLDGARMKKIPMLD